MLDRAQAAGVEKDPGAYQWTALRWLIALSPRRQTETKLSTYAGFSRAAVS